MSASFSDLPSTRDSLIDYCVDMEIQYAVLKQQNDFLEDQVKWLRENPKVNIQSQETVIVKMKRKNSKLQRINKKLRKRIAELEKTP